MLGDLGWTHIVILGGVLFLLFGARKFPEIGRNLGQGINNLYRGLKGALDDDSQTLPEPRKGPNLPPN